MAKVINLSDSTPAAPSGAKNVKWQGDSLDPRNASAYVRVFGASGASHDMGLVPDPGSTSGTSKYLREDGTWVAPSGSGGSGTSSPLYLAALDTVPDIADLTWYVSQDASASYEQHATDKSISVVCPYNNFGGVLGTTAPSTPWSLVIGIYGLFISQWSGFGIEVLDGTANHVLSFLLRERTNAAMPYLSIEYGSSGWNSYVSTPKGANQVNHGPMAWMKAGSDGTNVTFSLSADGRNWLEYYSEALSSHLPNGISDVAVIFHKPQYSAVGAAYNLFSFGFH